VKQQRSANCATGPPHRLPLPGLDAKVAFLRDPHSYPEATPRVEAIETHMSWVFVLEQHVYKLKKPVRQELLDFRSRAARRTFGLAELALNLRLAPGVYLGLVPLTCNGAGGLALAGHGTVVDWLVCMNRLPANRMLDQVLLHGGLPEADLARLAQLLAGFYRALPPATFNCAAWRERFRRCIRANRRELAWAGYQLPRDHVRALAAAQLAALDRLGPLLDQRVQDGHIVEGHGDLRPEHICLAEPVVIIDCLEYARTLRLVDAADEIGFLALECERLGAPATGRALAQRYAALSGDAVPAGLLHFYQSCRATTRALIAARHLLDRTPCDYVHWIRRAGQYLQLAEQHILSCDEAGRAAQPPASGGG
jgi:aminoglycoside phosphotransferase family enzyme